MKKLTVFILSLVFLSCMDKVDDRELFVINKSKGTIYSIISPNNHLGGSAYYTEFMQDYENKNNINSFIFDEIKPGEKVSNHDRPKDWISFIDNCEHKKLRLFIVSKDTVEKYGWPKLFKMDNHFNMKYGLSFRDLDKANWEIVYK